MRNAGNAGLLAASREKTLRRRRDGNPFEGKPVELMNRKKFVSQAGINKRCSPVNTSWFGDKAKK